MWPGLPRAKSQIVISFGSCACFGGTPGLGNVTNREEVFDTVYKKTQSTDNPKGIYPQEMTKVPEGELELPKFYNDVKTLDEVIDVDYFMPGCPPTVGLIAMAVDAVVQHVTKGAPLPPKGTVIASDKTLCDECNRRGLEEQEDRQDLSGLRDQGRPQEMPAGPGNNLHRACDQGRLRCDVPQREHALQRMHGPDQGSHRPRREHVECRVLAPEHHRFGVNLK